MWVYSAILLGLLGMTMPWDDDASEWTGYKDKPGEDSQVEMDSSEYTFQAYQKQGLKPADLWYKPTADAYAKWLESHPAK